MRIMVIKEIQIIARLFTQASKLLIRVMLAMQGKKELKLCLVRQTQSLKTY